MKEYQKELFESLTKPQKKKRAQKDHLAAKPYALHLSISYEKLIFFVIAFIMIAVLTFSLGVERGKKLAVPARPEIEEEPETETASVVNEEPSSTTVTTRESATTVIARRPERPTKQSSVAENLQPQTEPELPKVSKPYTIQVATYWSKRNAAKELERLKRKGMDSFIISGNGKYEICVGEYINKDGADASIKRLKKDYKDCFLRRR